MAFVAKFLNRAANFVNGCLDENIFFLHLPKCGGSSLTNALKDSYLSLDFRSERRIAALDSVASSKVVEIVTNKRYPFDTSDDYPILELREKILLYLMSQHDIRFISGHFTYSDTAYEAYGDKFAFVTVLRDPVARWISSYIYNRYKNKYYDLELNIEEYLETPFGRSQGCEYAKFLGGPASDGDYRSTAAIDRAILNLDKFRVVGCLESLDIFVNEFETQFGRKLKIEKRNTSPKPEAFRKNLVTDEIMQQIREVCAPDIEIYNHALSRWIEPNVKRG